MRTRVLLGLPGFLESDWWHHLWPILVGAVVTSVLVAITTWIVQDRVGKRLVEYQTDRDLKKDRALAMDAGRSRARSTVLKPALDWLEENQTWSVGAKLIANHEDRIYISDRIKALAATCLYLNKRWSEEAQAYREATAPLLPLAPITGKVFEQVGFDGMLSGEADHNEGPLGGDDPVAAFLAAEAAGKTNTNRWLEDVNDRDGVRRESLMTLRARLSPEQLILPRRLHRSMDRTWDELVELRKQLTDAVAGVLERADVPPATW